MQPKTKFFKGLDNTVALQAFRVQLKDNSLPFRISGDLSNPGIHYEEILHACSNPGKGVEITS